MPRAGKDTTTNRPDPPWPPGVGEPLPRAQDAYADNEKLEWLLSEKGHGREWARVLHVGPEDADRFFDAIRQAVIGATIVRVTDKSFGIACGVETSLTIGQRTTKALISWHYEHALDNPRLVTAYPRF